MAAQVPPAAAVPPVAVPAVPAAVPFALVPGDTAGVLDYTTRQGLEIFKSATYSLYQDPADNFNMEAAGLQTFLALLRHRGTNCGWDFDVPQDIADMHNDLLDLLTNHGRFTIGHLRAFAALFITGQNRAAQMNMQMVKCILASLTLPGFRKVQTWHTDWHIGTDPSAHLLIKVIIREAFIDTQATTRILREHLSSLPSKLSEMKGDIDQLNAFVKLTQDQLAARGEVTHDLLPNLFKGYLTSQDSTFKRYIENKQEDYDDGALFTVNNLMNLASNKFKTLKENGKWMSPNSDHAKLIALEAKLSTFANKAPATSGSKPAASSSKTQKKKGTNPSNKDGKRTSPEWMTKYPGTSFVEANQTKVVEGRTYWWCKKHKRFTMHKTSDCRLTEDSPSSGGTTPPSSNTTTTPSIRVSTATMMDE